MHSLATRFNPFPGLRPFGTLDKFLFFGREDQTSELLGRLRKSRFLAVVGTSGSGKSSLVRAGLIPGVHGGFMAGAGPNWRIAVMRPGGDPLGNLAVALSQLELLEIPQDPVAYIRATLERSAFGLTEFVEQSGLPGNHNLLIVVDQFEEVFRFRSRFRTLEEEAGGFVRLLIEAAGQKTRPIYVVLTMRSDFLGDCAEFSGLAEAINEGEYLIPRMKRDQCRLAIEGPVRVAGGRIAGRLVQRLLNDMGTDPDQLPVLQHALMRTWECWKADHAADEALDLRHYESVGGLTEALSRHADEVYGELSSERDRALTAALFKALTELGVDNRGIRRPARLARLCEILDVEDRALTPIIDRFRQPGRTFLMPAMAAPEEDEEGDEPAGEGRNDAGPVVPERSSGLSGNTVIDLSHESLMRLWTRLQAWVREEAASAAIYRRLADSARLRALGRFDLYHDPELQIALNWRRDHAPNAAWADRYAEGFDKAIRLLEESHEARESARREVVRRRRVLFSSITGVAALFLVLWLYAERAQRRATSRWLAIRSAEQVGVDPRESVLLARDAVRSWPTRDGVAALRKAVWNSHLSRDDTRLTSTNWDPLKDAANDGAFAPDGRGILIAVGTNAAVLNLEPGLPPRRVRGHTDLVRVAALSTDGTTALTAGWDGQAMLWNTSNWTRRATLSGHTAHIARGRFSRNGRFAVTAGADGTARVWDVSNGSQAGRIDAGDEVWSVDLNAAGDRLALGTRNGEISLWRWDTPQCLWRTNPAPRSRVLDVRFGPDDRVLASAGEDRRVLIWTRLDSTAELAATLEGHTEAVNMVAFSPGGRLVATAGFDGTARLWEWKSATEVAMFRHPDRDALRSVAFDSTGRRLVTVCTSGWVRTWETDVWELPETQDWNRVRWAVFAPDGRQLLVGNGTAEVRILRYPEGQPAGVLTGNVAEVTDAAFHPRSNLVVTAGADRVLRLWNSRDWTLHSTVPLPQTATRRSVAFSPNGRWLAVTQRDGVTIFDCADWKVVGGWTDHELDVTAVGFSADGSVLATSGQDNKVHWRLSSAWERKENPISHERNVNGIAFHPSDALLMVTASDIVRFFRRGDREWVRLRDGGGGPTNRVESLVFSPSGDCAVSRAGGRNGRSHLWDVATRGVFAELPSARGSSNRIAVFTPDGHGLVCLGRLGLVFESAALGSRDELLRDVDRHWGATRRKDDDDTARE